MQPFFKAQQPLKHCEALRFDPCDPETDPLYSKDISTLTEAQKTQIESEIMACEKKGSETFTESNGQMELNQLLQESMSNGALPGLGQSSASSVL